MSFPFPTAENGIVDEEELSMYLSKSGASGPEHAKPNLSFRTSSYTTSIVVTVLINCNDQGCLGLAHGSAHRGYGLVWLATVHYFVLTCRKVVARLK